jgi:transposase InsO family protein
MIHLKLRQAGVTVNHKRIERLYALEKLQIRRRRRKKVPMSERQPLIRPARPNQVWSIDFAFDRTASGRVLKCLVIVDDATAAPIQISIDHGISGAYLMRLLDQACSLHGKPTIIRSDNGPVFTSAAVLTWAHRSGIQLRLIEPGKPNQNAYVESFIGRFRDECLNEQRTLR